jgi:hypothetical protein
MADEIDGCIVRGRGLCKAQVKLAPCKDGDERFNVRGIRGAHHLQ